MRDELEAAAAGALLRLGHRADRGARLQRGRRAAGPRDLRPDDRARPAAEPLRARRPSRRSRSPARRGWSCASGGDRFLHLFGAGYADYVWTVFVDAAEHLGGRAVGADALRARAGARRRRCVTCSASGACGGATGELRDRYDVVIIGGGSHGLAIAYYLARDHGITDVCVLEQSYIGSGAAGRNTTILRSNYKTPEGARFYDASVKLYEGLSARARLQPAVLPAGPPDARPHRPGDVRDDRARRGQPPRRDRLEGDRPGGDPAPRPGDVDRRPTRSIR